MTPTGHFADRLTDAVRRRGNSVCVGLDPRWESLPKSLRVTSDDGTLEGIARAYESFCKQVIEIVAPLVPVVKPQSAFFEACGPAGMQALQYVMKYARENGLVTILDGKRNDIASTAVAYADAAFSGSRFDGKTHPVWDADALTINPYLGEDAIEPFVTSARESGRGVFVLVRTSNPGAGTFQDLVCDGRPLYQHVAAEVGRWANQRLGACGLGDVGTVVAATHAAELAAVREALPNVWFLVPGYGSQGATAADIANGFRPDGLGAVINSSRGVLFPYHVDDPNWAAAVETATRATISAIAAATPMGRLSL
jgi:orotidine-5'-phosphate decarboxylase